MRDVNLFGAGLMCGFAIEELGKRRLGRMVGYIAASVAILASTVLS